MDASPIPLLLPSYCCVCVGSNADPGYAIIGQVSRYQHYCKKEKFSTLNQCFSLRVCEVGGLAIIHKRT
jgi:hypothetical protein